MEELETECIRCGQKIIDFESHKCIRLKKKEPQESQFSKILHGKESIENLSLIELKTFIAYCEHHEPLLLSDQKKGIQKLYIKPYEEAKEILNAQQRILPEK